MNEAKTEITVHVVVDMTFVETVDNEDLEKAKKLVDGDKEYTDGFVRQLIEDTLCVNAEIVSTDMQCKTIEGEK